MRVGSGREGLSLVSNVWLEATIWRMGRIALAVAVTTCVVAPGAAEAADYKPCGSISGWTVRADSVATTCGLARSATRDYLRKLGRGKATNPPLRISGTNPKTGRRYRLELYSTTSRPTSTTNTYTGRAGETTLRVRITEHLS